MPRVLLTTSRYSRVCLPTACPSPSQPADGPAAAGRHLPPPLPAAVPHPHAGKACSHRMPPCSCSGTLNCSDMCLPALLVAEQLAASRPAAPANAPLGSWCGRKGPSLPPLQPRPAVVRAAAAEGQDWAAVQAARRSAGAQLWPMVQMQGTGTVCIGSELIPTSLGCTPKRPNDLQARLSSSRFLLHDLCELPAGAAHEGVCRARGHAGPRPRVCQCHPPPHAGTYW